MDKEDENAEKPWEEENGIYGIMVSYRLTSFYGYHTAYSSYCNFLSALKCDSFLSRFHFPSFTWLPSGYMLVWFSCQYSYQHLYGSLNYEIEKYEMNFKQTCDRRSLVVYINYVYILF